MPPTLHANSRIFVSGHRGLVGSAIVRHLTEAGFGHVLTAGREELDLRDQAAVDRWFESNRPEFVIHAAGKVGGIGANLAEPVEFAYDNLMIQATVLRASWQHGVIKLLYLASSCVYPRDCPQPMRETYLLTGPLEPSNEGYALAKIMGVKSCQFYRRQFGCRFISALPTNIYGPGDKFNPDRSHVIAGLIRKFHDAKVAGNPALTVWGSGTPLREFLHVDDLASACLFLLEHYDAEEPINVGTGEEIAISELAELIRDIVHPEAEVQYDTTKPDGTRRKLLDVSRLWKLGWRHRIELRDGLAGLYDWYLKHKSQGHV